MNSVMKNIVRQESENIRAIQSTARTGKNHLRNATTPR